MLKEINGDLVRNKDIKIFCHQTNCFNTMGGGIAYQISKLYPEVLADDYDFYSKYRNVNELMMGKIRTIETHDNRACINMYAQYSLGVATPETIDDSFHREAAFQLCLDALFDQVVIINSINSLKYVDEKLTIGFPKYIGCGLAGGQWDNYLTMISNFSKSLEEFTNVDVYIVNFDKKEGI